MLLPAFGLGGGVLYRVPMRALLIVVVFALVLYSLLDCARTPEENMPARMPKFLWVALIILFPAVGSIAWIIVSRVKAAEERGGYVEPTVWSSKEGTSFRRPERSRALGPDDDPDFLRDLEQGIRRRKHHGPDRTARREGAGGPGRTQSSGPERAEGSESPKGPKGPKGSVSPGGPEPTEPGEDDPNGEDPQPR